MGREGVGVSFMTVAKLLLKECCQQLIARNVAQNICLGLQGSVAEGQSAGVKNYDGCKSGTLRGIMHCVHGVQRVKFGLPEGRYLASSCTEDVTCAAHLAVHESRRS